MEHVSRHVAVVGNSIALVDSFRQDRVVEPVFQVSSITVLPKDMPRREFANLIIEILRKVSSYQSFGNGVDAFIDNNNLVCDVDSYELKKLLDSLGDFEIHAYRFGEKELGCFVIESARVNPIVTLAFEDGRVKIAPQLAEYQESITQIGSDARDNVAASLAVAIYALTREW